MDTKLNVTFYEFQHSTAMVKLKNVAQCYILQCIQSVIDFLIHTVGESRKIYQSLL